MPFPRLPAAACLIAWCAVAAGCGRGPAPRAFQGYVEGEFVHVAAALAGRVEKMSVTRGAEVAAGDPLFELEVAAEKAARAEAGERLKRAEASMALASANFARARELLDKRTYSKQEFDEAKADLDTAAAEQAAARQVLLQIDWRVDQKKVAAPVAGRVHDTLFREGEWAAAGAPVVSLLPPGNIKVRFFVPQEAASGLQPGDAVDLRVDGRAGSLGARVSYISAQTEFSPPVIYNRENRARLVVMIEAAPNPAIAASLHPGQPLDVLARPRPGPAP